MHILWIPTFTFTFMHLADAFIQSDLHCIQVTVSTFYQLLPCYMTCYIYQNVQYTNKCTQHEMQCLFILQRLTRCHTKRSCDNSAVWNTVSHALFNKNSRLYTVYSPQYSVSSSMLVIHSKHSHRLKINLIHTAVNYKSRINVSESFWLRRKDKYTGCRLIISDFHLHLTLVLWMNALRLY